MDAMRANCKRKLTTLPHARFRLASLKLAVAAGGRANGHADKLVGREGEPVVGPRAGGWWEPCRAVGNLSCGTGEMLCGRSRGGNRGSGSAGGSTAPDTALPPAPGSCACAGRRPAAHCGVRQNQAGTAGCTTTTPPPQHEARVTSACMGDIACIRLHVSLLAVKGPFCTRSLCSFNFALKAAVSATWQASSAPLATNDLQTGRHRARHVRPSTGPSVWSIPGASGCSRGRSGKALVCNRGPLLSDGDAASRQPGALPKPQPQPSSG